MTTNAADWTDAEIAQWMAERDGWRVEMQGEYWSGIIYHAQNARTGEQHTSQTREFVWSKALQDTPYPRSIDAAVGWLGRMGLEWMREPHFARPTLITVYDQHHRGECEESPTCSTARALCNAGVGAWLEREANNAD